MFDSTKITIGFEDLSICPRIKVTDRKIAVDHNCVLQKNGKTRFLIAISDEKDLAFASKDKSNYYIAKFEDIGLLLKVMFDPTFDNVIPELNVNSLIANKNLIMANLVESKDKFNIIIDIGNDIGSLFDLRSAENKDLMSLFSAIYRINGNDVSVNILNELKAIGIIADNLVSGIPISTNASSILSCFRALSSIYGTDAIKYTDLLENSKNNFMRVISDYDEKDPFAIKSVALGSQFIILNMPISVAKQKIVVIENMWIQFMKFINTSDFNDLFRCIDCGIISRC